MLFSQLKTALLLPSIAIIHSFAARGMELEAGWSRGEDRGDLLSLEPGIKGKRREGPGVGLGVVRVEYLPIFSISC